MALFSQEMMDLTGTPQNGPRKHNNFKDWLADTQIGANKKYRLIWQVAHFETLNGFTKKDLQDMLRWLCEEVLGVTRDIRPNLTIIEGKGNDNGSTD
ncbi:MAG: hypothetical protein IJ523_10460 [Succinivibrionaceae bacterium]|nr:hypothetical protein [Succinivibrionaceae bacterium]